MSQWRARARVCVFVCATYVCCAQLLDECVTSVTRTCLPPPVDSADRTSPPFRCQSTHSFICTCSFHITCHVLGTATPAHVLEGRSLKESAKRRVPAGIKRTIQSMGAQSGSGVGVRRRAKRRRKVLFPSGHTEDGSQKQCNIMCW